MRLNTEEMLVNLLVFLDIIIVCCGKSLDYRAKRSYYGAQALPQNDYYYPQVEGQPIYVPSIGHSASEMTELLDEYYRRYPAYAQAYAHPSSPYNENAGNYYESSATSNSMVKGILGAANEDGHRGDYHILPTEVPMKYEPIPTERYGEYVPDAKKEMIVKKGTEAKYVKNDGVLPDESSIKVVEKINKKDVEKTKSKDEFEKPLVLDKVKVKKPENLDVPKLEKYEDDYEPPVVRERINIKKSGEEPVYEKDLDKGDYEPPVVRERINIKKSGEEPIYEKDLDKGDYELPVVRDKVNVKKISEDKKAYEYEKDLYLKSVDENYEAPTVKDEKADAKEVKKDVEITKTKKKSKGKRKKKVKQKEIKAENKVLVKDEPKKYPVDETVIKSVSKKPPVKTKEKVIVKHEPKEPPVKTKEKVVIKHEPKVPPVKTKEKVVIKSEQKTPVKDEKIEYEYDDVYEPKEPPVKTKEKVVIKHEPKEPPVKTKEKVVIKHEPKGPPVKTKEKVVIKHEPKGPPVKTKEKVVIKHEPKGPPVKTKEKVVIKSEQKTPVKDEKIVYEYDDVYKSKGPDVVVKKTGVADDPELPLEELKASEDLDLVEDVSTNESEGSANEPERPLDAKVGTESSTPVIGGDPMNSPKFLPNNAVKRLSSLNANIWSLVFNPNAVPKEGLKLKKCLTRNNETGFCTYVQNCEVPDIAASLEQLLNNACVIDDVFIGVCCPEFPVQAVAVHWEDEISNSGKQSEAEFEQTAEDCGIRSNEAIKQQSWPWKAPLVSMSNGKIFCGGVIINENYVLTAAHCTTKIPKNQILVRLGQFDDSTGEDFAVVEIKRHAQYNPRTMHNDIALLKLGRRILPDEHTGVICLPDDEEDDDEHDGEKAILLGWKGMFGKNSKKTEFLEVMEREECSKKLRQNVPKTMLCTEARNEDERTCNADSGAPLVIEDDDKYEVIGILSWNRNDCDQRFPSTFSRVSRYVGWIRKHAV